MSEHLLGQFSSEEIVDMFANAWTAEFAETDGTRTYQPRKTSLFLTQMGIAEDVVLDYCNQGQAIASANRDGREAL